MAWQKLGLVYAPDGSQWWARTHCHMPTPLRLGHDILRIYFAGLDENQFGRVGYVDIDANNPRRVISCGTEPVLDLGELGTFDDSGVVPSCTLTLNGQVYLYYVGFQRAQRVPYLLFTGLAIGPATGASFTRVSRSPVLDRTNTEPFSRGAPFVMRREASFRMWYWSCTHWTRGPSTTHYNTVIRSATSDDAVHWVSTPTVGLAPRAPEEFALGRPAVIHDGGCYRMWYSIRGRNRPYTIGYAESVDGLFWERRDSEAGIIASEQGWDAEMICYPAVIDTGRERFLFYNGNGHGKTGFGAAVWVSQ